MNAVSWFDGLAAPGRLRESLHVRGPQIALWVLAVALAAQAATIVTHLAGAGRAPTAKTAAPATAASRPRVDIGAIANSHLFGAAPVAQASEAADAPQTSMPLVLTGIIAERDPKDGMAILGPSATAAKVYAVGESVPGGARVHEVYEDRVLIDRGGRIESLMLPRQHVGGPPPPLPPLVSGENPLDRARRMITDNPAVIGDLLRPQPVMQSGKLLGYRLMPGRNPRAFARLGLRPGDLVVGVNGTPLDDTARAQEVLGSLNSAGEARLTVRRNGRQQDLTVNMAQLSDAEQLIESDASQSPSATSAPAAAPQPVPPVPQPAPPAQADQPNANE